jgi:uncharacterized protein (TIGR02444 family)
MNAGESAFWRFSLRFYRRPAVPPLCMALQDSHGVDVNVLFLLLFLALHQRRLSAVEVRRIDHCAAAWRARAVQPLRALRRDLKSGVAPIEPAATEALRTEIKRCELHAERLQQEMLERLFPVATVGTHSAVALAAADNVAAYGEVAGALPDEMVQSLLTSFAMEFGESGT